jgi:hypothetical protein
MTAASQALSDAERFEHSKHLFPITPQRSASRTRDGVDGPRPIIGDCLLDRHETPFLQARRLYREVPAAEACTVRQEYEVSTLDCSKMRQQQQPCRLMNKQQYVVVKHHPSTSTGQRESCRQFGRHESPSVIDHPVTRQAGWSIDSSLPTIG